MLWTFIQPKPMKISHFNLLKTIYQKKQLKTIYNLKMSNYIHSSKPSNLSA